MKNGNLIDFKIYKQRQEMEVAHNSVSEELISEIQCLIRRLREHNPLEQPG